MSYPDLFSALRSSDHGFIAALRFLDDYAKHICERGRHHQSYHHFVPRFDLEQHADTYELYGELPGFRREDVIIEAHDVHNLQVSGSISRLTFEPQPSSESKESKDATNSTTKPQDEIAPKDASNAEEPKIIQESISSANKALPKPDARERTTTEQERYLNARFGDVLDPHANFARDQDDAAVVEEPVPKVRHLISERHPSSFHRAFHFPTPIKKDEIIAMMQDGILHITAPRAPMPPPVKVKVRNDVEYYPEVLV
jgi:HSP20 family molecular chaperone IbpA